MFFIRSPLRLLAFLVTIATTCAYNQVENISTCLIEHGAMLKKGQTKLHFTPSRKDDIDIATRYREEVKLILNDRTVSLHFGALLNGSLDKWHGKLTTRCGGTVVVSVVVYSPNDTQVTSVASIFPHVIHATELQAMKK